MVSVLGACRSEAAMVVVAVVRPVLVMVVLASALVKRGHVGMHGDPAFLRG